MTEVARERDYKWRSLRTMWSTTMVRLQSNYCIDSLAKFYEHAQDCWSLLSVHSSRDPSK